MNPWMKRPTRTVMKYMPSWPRITLNESISMIFEHTRKRTPTGDSLSKNQIFLQCPWKLRKNKFTHQITQLVMIIIAAERASKKFNKGLPLGPIFPSVIPNTVAKTTRPRIFIPGVSSPLISHVSTASVKIQVDNWLMKIGIHVLWFLITIPTTCTVLLFGKYGAVLRDTGLHQIRREHVSH